MRQTGPMQQATAARMRATAQQLDKTHPETTAAGHVRDAAITIASGRTDGAKRHLDAAMEVLTPRNLARHGILDDQGHTTAKQAMHQVHRLRLAVMDIEDIRTANQAEAERRRSQAADDAEAKAKAAAIKTGAFPQPTETDANGSSPPQAPTGKAQPNADASPAGGSQPPVTSNTSAGSVGSSRQTSNTSRTIPAKARPPAAAGKGAQLSNGIELAFNPAEPRGKGGEWERMAGEFTRLANHMAAPREQGGHGLSREAVTRVGHTSSLLRRLHQMQHGYGRQPGHDHPPGQLSGDEAFRIEQTLIPPSGGELSAQLAGIELSSRTAMLEHTPAPYGKPGGPGLYGKAGNKHSDYFEQIVQALMRKRGMSKAQASAIAWGAIKRWSAGGGKVHPEVRAAAGRALGQEAVAGGQAHSADPWGMADRLIELAFNPHELRGPNGEWISLPGGKQARVTKLKYAGGAGGFGHLRAIDAIGDKYQPQGDLKTINMGPASDVYRSSMRAAARFTAARQMEHAYRALDTADWAARHIGPDAQIDAQRVRASLAAVPGYVSKRQNPRPRPAGVPWEQGIHPGIYRDPMNISNTGQLSIELSAGGPQWQGEPRTVTGQFGSGGQQGSGGGGKGKAARQARRAQLVKKAASLRAQIKALEAMLPKTGHKSSSSSKAGKSKSSTPAKKGAGAISSKAAKASSTKTAATHHMSTATIHAKINALRAELAATLRQIHQLSNDGDAIELAWTGWIHQLRDRYGRWTSTPGMIKPVQPPRPSRLAGLRARAGHELYEVHSRDEYSAGLHEAQRSLTRMAGVHPLQRDETFSKHGKPLTHAAMKLAEQRQEGTAPVPITQADLQKAIYAAASEMRTAEFRLRAEEDKKRREKLAVHAGAIVGGAALTYAETKLGAPGIAQVMTAPGVLVAQELIDWARRL